LVWKTILKTTNIDLRWCVSADTAVLLGHGHVMVYIILRIGTHNFLWKWIILTEIRIVRVLLTSTMYTTDDVIASGESFKLYWHVYISWGFPNQVELCMFRCRHGVWRHVPVTVWFYNIIYTIILCTDVVYL